MENEKVVEKEEVHPAFRSPRSFAQKAADSVTKWVGSWTFIIAFLAFIVLWMGANVYAWVNEWDAYPFILLNLVLSTVAAIQAPIILMSNNREAQRDRLRTEYDYTIDKKAEQEIREIKQMLMKMNKK
ncbi:MAG TPA: DUF1003 domain-containing protein [Candidatus Nanoarchaeia archaeon]|nr:DUF1003 domain-containing protein [Candidatus Nanoarchaeia archaeon]